MSTSAEQQQIDQPVEQQAQQEQPAAEVEADAGIAEDQEFQDREIGAILRNLSTDEIDMLRDAFIHMDRDSDGFVGLEEMMAKVREVVGEERYQPLREYLDPIFKVADKDKDNRLSLTEFLSSFANGPGVVPADVVNSCVNSIRVRLSDEEIAALQESFRRIDKNQDGFIDRDELTVALKEILLAKFPDLTDHTFSEIVSVVLASADGDRDGKLSLSEFIRSFQEDQGVLPAAFIDVRAQHVVRQLTKEEVEVLKEAFTALDKNQDGFVDFVEMYQALWDALENSVQDKSQIRELCDLIMVTADRDHSGKLTLTDFIRNFLQNVDLMKIPVAAAQERIRKSRERIETMLNSGEVEKLVKVFADLDTNGDGFLDHAELQGTLTALFRESFPEWSPDTVEAVIDAVISGADTDQDGKISFSEFIQSFVDGAGILPDSVVQNWDGVAATEVLNPDELAVVAQTFNAMDADADGYVSREELKKALAQALEGLVDEQKLQLVTDYVLSIVDTDDDGKVSWNEFKRSFELRQGVLPVAVEPEAVPAAADGAETGNEQAQAEEVAPATAEAESGKAAVVAEEQREASDSLGVARPISPVAEQLYSPVAAQTAAQPAPQQHVTPDRRAQPTDDEARSPIVNDVSGVAISEHQLKREFAKYDKNGTGYLSRADFKKAYLSMEHYGLVPSQAQIDAMFNKYGSDERLSFNEFCVLMLHRSRM